MTMPSDYSHLNEQEVTVKIEQLQQERADHLQKAEQIDAAIADLRHLQKEKAAQAIAEIAKRAGLEITVKKARKPRAAKAAGDKKPSAPKFRDPATGKTWSGKGKRPQWAKEEHRIRVEG
jgi:DNA-binding protein H-NS